MFRKLLALLALTMVAMLLLAACGDDDPTATPGSAAPATTPAGAGDGDAIRVEMLDTMRFNPDTITVAPGQEVTIDLVNAGAIVHNFTLRGEEDEVSYDLDGRQEDTFTFTAPSDPGEYEIYCDVPGHEQAGMVGTLVVQ